jgi:predicted porin
MVEIGRDYTPIFSLSAATDTSMADNVNIGKSVYLNGAAPITTVRNNGQIMYTLPTMGGVTAKVAIANRGADPDANGNVESVGGSIVYNAGPLMLGAAMNTQETTTCSAAATAAAASQLIGFGSGNSVCDNAKPLTMTKREETLIGGTYMVNKVLSFQAQWGELKTGGVKTYGGYQVGARYNITPNLMIHASGGSGDGSVGDLTAYKFGLINSLSKRTRLYALFGTDDLKVTGKATRERSEFAVGLNHAF